MRALPSRRGCHVLADLYGVDAARLCGQAALQALMCRAARAAGATVIGEHFHTFGPHLGVTGVVLLAESHLSVHTWPEERYAAFDIFMCGAAKPDLALQILLEALAPAQHQVRELLRGEAPAHVGFL